MKRVFFQFLVLCAAAVSAQVPTGTEIWLVELTRDYTVVSATNITHRDGYDNQPAFSPDEKYLLYTSIREDKQADIYKYTLGSKQTDRLTFTPESEYSPTFMSGGKSFSTVRVEADSSQRLWKFNLADMKPSLVNKYVDSIGYHCWLDQTKIAVFLLTQPFTLQLMDVESKQTTLLAKDIGRSIHRGMEGNIIFTQLIDSVRWICSVDPATKKIDRLVKTPGKSEDIVLVDDHTFLMARGGQLLLCDLRREKEWKPVCSLEGYGIKNITRIARSRDGKHIAVVDNN